MQVCPPAPDPAGFYRGRTACRHPGFCLFSTNHKRDETLVIGCHLTQETRVHDARHICCRQAAGRTPPRPTAAKLSSALGAPKAQVCLLSQILKTRGGFLGGPSATTHAHGGTTVPDEAAYVKTPVTSYGRGPYRALASGTLALSPGCSQDTRFSRTAVGCLRD